VSAAGGAATKEPAIHVANLAKVFKIYRSPRDILIESLTHRQRHSEWWALRDVSFDVQHGEVVGIIGRNGAGKSTLLKILAGTLDSTSGGVMVNGRVTAILELGSGFHAEYSGRENIYMGGFCLGMSREEVESKIEGIIAFSELREFIDHPFRTYSTGMQARLTFSTAISVDPDILIVDEALSVGDAKFQLKCFRRIMDLKERGKTILLVSHDTGTITTFCDHAILLERGHVREQGSPREMTLAYRRLLFGPEPVSPVPPGATGGTEEEDDAGGIETSPPGPATVSDETEARVVAPHGSSDSPPDAEQPAVGEVERPRPAAIPALTNPSLLEGAVRDGDGSVHIMDFGIVDAEGNRVDVLESGASYSLFMRYRPASDAPLSCGFILSDSKGTVVWGVTTMSQGISSGNLGKGQSVLCRADLSMWLAAGYYVLGLGIAHRDTGVRAEYIEDAMHLKVEGPGGIFTNSLVNLDTTFSLRAGE